MRMTLAEIRASAFDGSAAGSSGLPGVQTRVLAGDPSATGYYAILLSVPAHTTIPAHTHRDDRMATVLSGDWRFGYGDRFEESSLKTLTPGSVYSEPGGASHFARTDDEGAVVLISGNGPTDTRYVDGAK
jgi:quercetin dioxygenase-like cupin family protein